MLRQSSLHRFADDFILLCLVFCGSTYLESGIATRRCCVLTIGVSDTRPAVVSFVATYLKPEMLHVYRQTTGLQRHENWIVTRRRQSEDRYPAPKVIALPRHPLRWFHRAWHQARRLRPPLAPWERKQLQSVCDDTKARLVHIYFGTEAARCITFLRKARLPRIVSFHGADLSEKLKRRELEDLVRHTDLFLCRSQSLADVLVKRGVDKARIRLNYTGVPVPSAVHEARSGSCLRILQACRFLAKKGLDTTLLAVASLRAAGQDLRLTLAGDGEERKNLEALAVNLGIADITTFAGFLGEESLRRLYLEHDIFVHPSRTTATGDREGIPNSLLEAMACGLPSISTRHSGIPEAVTHEKTGWLLDESDASELVSAISKLALSTTLRQQIGAAARQSIIDKFSISACVSTLEDAYEEVGRKPE